MKTLFWKRAALAGLIFLSLVACCRGDKEEFQFISTEELSQGIKNGTLMVFDNNTPELFKKKHIPTAIFMDYKSPDPKLLPANKSAPLVFYCKNTRCTASHQGASFAKSQAYSNIRVYPLGIDGWEEAGMPVEVGEPLLKKTFFFDPNSTVPKSK